MIWRLITLYLSLNLFCIYCDTYNSFNPSAIGVKYECCIGTTLCGQIPAHQTVWFESGVVYSTETQHRSYSTQDTLESEKKRMHVGMNLISWSLLVSFL